MFDDGLIIPPHDDEAHWSQTPSGLFVPQDLQTSKWIYGPRPLGVDLFCGCGGFSLGMMQAGFRIVAAVENSVEAAITYLVNLGSYPFQWHFVTPADRDRMEKYLSKDSARKGKRKKDLIEVIDTAGSASTFPNEDRVPHFWFGDIRNIRGEEMLEALGLQRGDLDVVCGGPPCQGFTTANSRRSVEDPRNSLVFEFMRLTMELYPKTWVMENVPGMLQMTTPEGIPVIDALARIAEDGNFGTFEGIRSMLLKTAGAGAVLRSKPRERAAKKPPPKRKKPPQSTGQGELFPEKRKRAK